MDAHAGFACQTARMAQVIDKPVEQSQRSRWLPLHGAFALLAVAVLVLPLAETGLEVLRWGELAYGIEVAAPDLGWDLRVEVHRVDAVGGEPRIDDPDGIVTDACYVHRAECADRLTASHPWVREPLSAWIAERWPQPRDFRYRVSGSDPRSLQVDLLP